MNPSPSYGIAPAALREVLAHAERDRPRECCGVLLGDGGTVFEAVPIANIAASRDRFLLDPKQHIDARRDARRRGLQVVGYYHSHPHSAPAPSATDLEEAADDDALHVIVGQGARGQWLVRAFRLAQGQAREIGLQ